MNRVVVTGIGVYSCIGKNTEEVRQSLYTGKSGIGFDPVRKELGFRSGLTGIVEKPNLKGLLDRRLRVGMAEQGEYAYLSTLEALNNAKADPDYIEKVQAGILFGNDTCTRSVIESIDLLREKRDTGLLGSGYIFQSMNSTVTMNLSVIFKLKGINFTISGACAGGSHAIGLGYLFIKWGLQQMVVCGGAQEINEYSMASFDALSAFSIRESDPGRASRPFDKNRDGLVPSGGAGTVILESYESAVKRGAPILGEIIGYGFSSNGEHISQSTVDGLQRAMNLSLRDADLRPGDIEYINAHATSTPGGDASEARAIHSIFGEKNVPVSSTKSMTGHECWMAGASEVVYSLLMMQNDFLAPNINFEEPDEDSAKLDIITQTRAQKTDVLLTNSFGFGGTNSSLIIKKLA